jgi:hypothetical protein
VEIGLGKDGGIKVGLRDSRIVGVRVGVWHVHRIREHVRHVRIHGRGLEVCRLFGSDSLDGEHLELRIGVDVVRENYKIRVRGCRDVFLCL